MKVIDLLNKIANGEIEEGTIFEVLGDFFYKLIVINENLYCINICSNQLQLVESKYIGRFISKQYDIVEIGNKIEDTPKEEIQVLSRWYQPKEDKKIEKLDYLNSDYYYKNNTYGAISNEEIVLDIKAIENYINKLVDRLNGEDNEQ